ncbi:MAG: SDR family oxidoreductase [Candidatus Kapabacteria bacterium]|nr:SDR family oxidoreductase [Candidatus Kapabacteria bacterium]
MPTVLITGGARRLGAAFATAFAARGYDVGITYRTSASAAAATVDACAAAGVQAAMRHCDVADAAALELAVTSLIDELGTPDVIVSNAGIFPDRTSVDRLQVDAVRHAIDVNTLPLVTLAKVYHDCLVTSSVPHGRLISISSLGALEIWRDRLAYNVSKSALLTTVMSLARSAAPRMSVNSVAPGAILMPHEPTSNDAAMLPADRIPMGRHGSADDVMDAVWFFATCSPYVTGQVLTVDGGSHLS